MERFILEPERKIPVDSCCDVLVAGGGIAGIAAAIAAARCGKRVTLVEREYALGGMATLGLITIYLPLCDGEGNQLCFGIAEELLKLSIKHGAEANYPQAWLCGGSFEDRVKNRYMAQFNPHLFALSAEMLLRGLGVNILYGTLVCSVRKDGSKISHVIVENKSGRSAIAVSSVIDCTGDADICHMSGAKTALHTRGNALASWYYYFCRGEVSLKMFGLADPPAGRTQLSKTLVERYNALKTGSLHEMRFSGVDGAQLSRAVIAAHQKLYEDILKFRAEDKTFSPVATASVPLVRMSRRLCGAYMLDESENRKFMPDSIGMTGDWRHRGPAFELPFGTLYCFEVPNLLAAGRCISVTDDMWDITRVIPTCAVTGQAAGTAAALGSDFTKINVAQLQEILSSNGVKLHMNI